MRITDDLRRLIAEETGQPVSRAAQAVSAAIVERHARGIVATIFYGSCLRPAGNAPGTVDAGTDAERVLDFYAIVDDLMAANPSLLRGIGNRLLPPNVFYIEVPDQDRMVRCKYALMSLAQFETLTRPDVLQNYFWGRFCQPCAILFVRSDDERMRLHDALANASLAMLGATLPLIRGPFDADALWIEALNQSYRAELRAEHPAARARVIFAADAPRYRRFADAILPANAEVVADGDGRLRYVGKDASAARRAWWQRRLLGKTLNALRVVKAGFTFTNGLDYLLWKIERHSGVRVPTRPWEHRHPVICAPVLAWRAWRAGAFR